jgi:hypothetical protein
MGGWMKKLIWLIILAAAGYLAYTQFFPRFSEEEKLVRELEKTFDASARAFVSSSRQMAEPGTAAIADPEAAVEKIKDVETRLVALRKELKEEAALARAEELQGKIRNFYEKNEIK